MSSSPLSRDFPASRNRATAWLYKGIPVWTILVFCAAIAAAYSPNVLQVYSLNDDYDVLVWKSEGFVFFHIEALHLLADARPVAALFTNLPIWFVKSMADFRWVRVFSLVTVGVLGAQMIANCVARLHVRPLDSIAVALATFLGPAFIYATMDASAWAPHLLTTFIAFSAYTILGRSNLQLVPFLLVATRRDWRALGRQILAYSFSRPVCMACLVYQLALYDYPSFALILTAFPVIAILFSQAPRAYRTLVAVRDILFVGAGLAIYSLSTATIYLPFIRRVIPDGTNEPGYASYTFQYLTDPAAILGRLRRLMTLSGDLWFSPLIRMHVLTGAILLLALVAATGMALLERRGGQIRIVQEDSGIGRLRLNSWTSNGVVAIAILVICSLMSTSPVWGAIGGFIAYRTSVGPTALAAIVFTFAVRGIAEAIWKAAGNPHSAAAKVADAAMALTVCVAFAASFYLNYSTMKLARNEFAYFTGIVRQAIDNKSKTIVLNDPRHQGPDMSMAHDQQGHAAPSYEIGCFATYCGPRAMIVHVAAAQFGVPFNAFTILMVEQFDIPLDVFASLMPNGVDLVPGLTCEMLTAPKPSYPPSASMRLIDIIDRYRTLAPLTCVTVSTAWHDLGVDLSR